MVRTFGLALFAGAGFGRLVGAALESPNLRVGDRCPALVRDVAGDRRPEVLREQGRRKTSKQGGQQAYPHTKSPRTPVSCCEVLTRNRRSGLPCNERHDDNTTAISGGRGGGFRKGPGAAEHPRHPHGPAARAHAELCW